MAFLQKLFSLELVMLLLRPGRAIPERMQEPVNTGRNIHLLAHGYGKDVSPCMRHARKDHCRISDCLRTVFSQCPDAPDASIMDTFCEASRRESSPFSHRGLKWIRHTSHCMVISLSQQARMTPCDTIDMLLGNVFDECATDNRLCDIIETDYDALAEVFKGSWMPIVKAARQCSRDVLDAFVRRAVDYKEGHDTRDL